MNARVLVRYYSSHRHVETLASAVAEGARTGGTYVDIKRVPELVSEAIAREAHFKLDQAAPVGLDYGYAGQTTLDEISGCSPYGASTIAGGDGRRMPTRNELGGASHLGRRVAQVASRLHA